MRQIDFDYLVITGLLLSGLTVAVTGFLMDLFGSPQFVWHRYAGYTSTALVGLHLTLNWERITAYLKWRLKTRPGQRTTTGQQYTPRLGRRDFFMSVVATAGGFVLGRVLPSPVGVAPQAAQRDPGLTYHQRSQPTFALASLLNWGQQPARYKSYGGSPRLALPSPPHQTGVSVEEAITRRRSKRDYSDEPLSQSELSSLLYAAAGLTDPARELRAAPSAGALYPIETYLVVNQVSGVEPGLFHYNVPDHALEQLQAGDLRTKIVVAGAGQEMLGQAAVCVVLSAVFQRTRWKYRERAYRYILLEAGHIGQNLYLAATSLGLGACAVGAFHDDKLNDLLGLDGEDEAALYILAIGKV